MKSIATNSIPPRRPSFYQELIAKALQNRKSTPPLRFVEAHMRAEWGTLDNLSWVRFAKLARYCADMVATMSEADNDDLARGFGL